ncbi:hypothetical protein [Escherichia coli]|nr:hypothetical protein [Escherichia coli]
MIANANRRPDKAFTLIR